MKRWLPHLIRFFALFATCALANAEPELAARAASYGLAIEAAHAALRQGRFAELNEELARAQTEYEADTNAEERMSASFRRFRIADPELEAAFDEWVKAYPESYGARMARGLYLFAMGRAWRGFAYIDNTHPTRLDYMDGYLKRSFEDLEAATTLTAKPILAYQVLIDAAQLVGGGAAATEVLNRAMKTDPHATGPYFAYANMQKPRWGGSYDAMRMLAAQVETESHPKMKRLARQIRSMVISDQTDADYDENNRLAALKGYQEAIAVADDNTYAHCMLGWLYHALGQTDNALAALNRAVAANPGDTKCLVTRADAQYQARRDQAMLDDLREAATLGDQSAARRLGYIFSEGTGNVARDLPQALHWLERAAYFWDIQALFQLGLIHERGLGIKPDHAKAVGYYRACANLRDTQCENNLGLMLWYGRGAEANPEEAARLWIRVHKKGEWRGGHNLEYFFSPTERVFLALRHGPGKWAQAPLATLGLLLLGAIVIAWIMIRRPFAPRAKRASA